MKKFGRALALMTTLALLAGSASIDAQEKKGTETKKSAAADKVSGAIEVYKTEKGKWRYKVLKNVDGEMKTIAMPLAQLNWETKAEAEKAVEELKTILNTAKPTEPKEDKK
jgi:uncharacterized protein YegP (UPF0339 family)